MYPGTDATSGPGRIYTSATIGESHFYDRKHPGWVMGTWVQVTIQNNHEDVASSIHSSLVIVDNFLCFTSHRFHPIYKGRDRCAPLTGAVMQLSMIWLHAAINDLANSSQTNKRFLNSQLNYFSLHSEGKIKKVITPIILMSCSRTSEW